MTVVVPIGQQGVGESSSGTERLLYLSAPSCNPGAAPVSFGWGSGTRTAELSVYDLSGRRIAVLGRDLDGTGTASWDLTSGNGEPVRSGVYMVRLSGSRTASRRLVVIR